MNREKPKIRPLEAFRINVSGKDMIGVKDPLSICTETFVVSPDTFFIISKMDGTKDVRDIQMAFMHQYGQLIFTEAIETLIDQLDSLYLLDNSHFQKRRQQIIDEFKNNPIRKARFAGQAYESDPDNLLEQFRGYFTDKNGPGLPLRSSAPVRSG